MTAHAAFSEPGITCTVETWAGPVRAGLHPYTGGDGADACSGDMLLQALLACAGVTMRSVATAMGIEVRGGRLTATAEMDARGTLGVSREARGRPRRHRRRGRARHRRRRRRPGQAGAS